MNLFYFGWREAWELMGTKVTIGLILIFVGLILLRASISAQNVERAPREPNLSGQWDAETHTLLAAAVVGEAGWKPVADHAAIPWLLHRRWRRNPNMPFRSIVRTYCKVLNGARPWLLELDAEGNKPRHWPADTAWEGKHRALWLAAYERIGRWAAGDVADPCKAADHFGSPDDSIVGKALVPVRCPGAVNKYYRISKGG